MAEHDMTEAARTPTARKRHHFVPIAYLKAWAKSDGKVFAYLADKGGEPLDMKPDQIGFERYYYSFTAESGEPDHDSFEEMFGRVETHWPRVLAAVTEESLSPEIAHWLYAMMTIMRTRGPAARDFNQALIELEWRTTCRILAERGRLPAKLKRYEAELDTVRIAISEEQTLRKMSDGMRHLGDLTRPLGFEILVNDTATDFITSDNPVVYFDGEDLAIKDPYSEASTMELLFPLSPRYLLRGSYRLAWLGQLPSFRRLGGEPEIAAVNEITARYAYRMAFARDKRCSELIEEHRLTSPMFEGSVVQKPNEVQFHIGSKFKPRRALNKFRPELCDDNLYASDFDDA